jgi:DUF4097 and DUF4098 domain-containing protein YvlB
MLGAMSLPLFALLFCGCSMGPAATGSFDRTLAVSGPIRLELANAAGDVSITPGPAGAVHIHGNVRASGIGFDNPQKRLDEIIAKPSIELRGSTVRIGKDMSRIRNVAISYVIEVPRETEISTTVASGSETVHNVQGPVTMEAASGSIRVDGIDRQVQLTSISGSIEAHDIGDELKISGASGNVNASNVKGDVDINILSGSVSLSQPSGRVEARTASGTIDVAGASGDVTAQSASGRVTVQGTPKSSSYWNLRTVSGTVELTVPASANFHLSADAISGEIKAGIPIVIEEQSKRSLRAHVGTDGGRIEIHTTSGNIVLRPH